MRYPRLILALGLLTVGLFPLPGARLVHADEVYPDCKGVNVVTLDRREYTATGSGSFAVYWTSCYGGDRDWVGIFPAGVGASVYAPVAYVFTNGTAHGDANLALPATTPTGLYEARYYTDRAGITSTFVAVSAPMLVHGAAVTPIGTVSHVWSSLSRGSSQSFTWTASPPSGLDRVQVYGYGGALVTACYTDGTGSGQVLCPLDAGLAPGMYVGCLYSGLTNAQLACDATFSVT